MKVISEALSRYTSSDHLLLFLSGIADDLEVGDVIGESLVIYNIFQADHDGKDAVRFQVDSAQGWSNGGQPLFTEHHNVGRIVLHKEVPVEFRRSFPSVEARDKFREDLDLPKGCEYVLARQLDKGQLVVDRLNGGQRMRPIASVNIKLGDTQKPVVWVTFRGSPEGAPQAYLPNEMVVVSKKKDK